MLLSLASVSPPLAARRSPVAAAAPFARKAAPRAVLCRGSASAAAAGSSSSNSVGGDAAATEAETLGLACPLSSRPLSSRPPAAAAAKPAFFTHYEKTRVLPALAACLAVLAATAGDPRALFLLLSAATDALPFLAPFALVALVAAVATVVAGYTGNRDAASRARAFAARRFLKLALAAVFFLTVARGVLPAGLFPPPATSVIELRRFSAAAAASRSAPRRPSTEPFSVVAVPSLVAELLLRGSSSSRGNSRRKGLLGAGDVLLSAALGVVCGIGTFFAYNAMRWIVSKVKEQREGGDEARAVVELSHMPPPLPLVPPPRPLLPPLLPPPLPPPQPSTTPPSEPLEAQLRKSKQELSASRAEVKALAAELDRERGRRQKLQEKKDDGAALAAAVAAASSFAGKAPRSSSQPLLSVIREASKTLAQTRAELMASRARERAAEEKAKRAQEELEVVRAAAAAAAPEDNNK